MERITISIVTALSMTALTACNNEQPAKQAEQSVTATTAPTPITIKDLQWLAGKWHHADSKGITYENWKQVDDSTMHCESGSIKGKDTSIGETVSLELRGGAISYIPIVKDQNGGQPIPFKMTFATADSFVFENPEHDLPTRITYVRQSASVLMASISGKMNGKQHTEQFPMTKVE